MDSTGNINYQNQIVGVLGLLKKVIQEKKTTLSKKLKKWKIYHLTPKTQRKFVSTFEFGPHIKKTYFSKFFD